MRTYTVHEPASAGSSVEDRASRLVFTKEGFALWALVAPLLWLLFNRLWWELILFLLLTIAVVIAVKTGAGSDVAAGWASFLLNLVFAFEARDIKRRALERRGHRLVGIVTARNLEEAERRFLTEWLPRAQAEAPKQVSFVSGEPPREEFLGAGARA